MLFGGKTILDELNEVCDCCYEEERCACRNVEGFVPENDCYIRISYNELKKAEKYRWHDLRKNPDDVPDEPYEPVLVAIDIGCGEVDYDIFCYGIENWSARMVIAWKHIEPFEEEDR